MIGSSHTMYERPKAQSTSDGRPSSSKQTLLTPTTNSPTHITIPQSPDQRYPERSSATSLSNLSRSNPPSDSKYIQPRGEFSFSDDASIPVVEDQNLDDLWGSIRQKNALRMSRQKPKVKSLEDAALTQSYPSVDRDVSDPPRQAAVQGPPQSAERDTSDAQRKPQKSVKKVKSLTTLQVSDDGRTVVAFFDLKGATKDNVHVSFKPPQLYVSWWTETVNEFEDEEGRTVIEKIHKDYQRTLPLPEGTKFEEIRGTMNGRHLVMKLPNCRSFRVERVFDEEDID